MLPTFFGRDPGADMADLMSGFIGLVPLGRPATVDEIAKTPVSDGNGTVSGKKPMIESVRIVPGTLEVYGIKK